jgi:alanyl aminopeptidase
MKRSRASRREGPIGPRARRSSSAASFAVVFASLAAVAEGSPGPPKLRLPAGARPVSYAVALEIVPARDAFHGTVDIVVRLEKATSLLWLNGKELEIEKASASLGGHALAARVVAGGEEFVGFAFDREVGPGELLLSVSYRGKFRERSSAGLFRQKDGGSWYVFSMFEATDARRAFPCFDEPSYKTPWVLTLRVPRDISAVSNTPIASETTATNGMKTVRFGRTPPLPSYLVAFAVGPFEFVDAGRAGAKKTPIRIIVPGGKTARARYAARTTGPILDRLEAYFGIPYPYEKLDQLAIPQTVAFGAMENAGLVTWSEGLLLASPEEETVALRRTQTQINAHELAHQWFGDLVTLSWWDDTWLNESFADWMGAKITAGIRPDWKVDVSAVSSASEAMDVDTLATARQIHQPIETADDIDNAFDAITYNKGGAVLSAFEAWVGPDRFRAGVRRYLAKHRFGNATAEDFLAALEAESMPGAADSFRTFLDQPGVPAVTVSLICDGTGPARLGLSQKRLLPVGSKGPAELWRVPICARVSAGGQDGRFCTLLTKESDSVALPGGACPDWLVAKDAGIGYFRALYSGGLLEKLRDRAMDLTTAERVSLVRDTAALAGAGALPTERALDLVPRFAADPQRQVATAALEIAERIRHHLVAADRLPSYARFVSRYFGERARQLGWTAKPGEDDETRLLRLALIGFVTENGDEPALQSEARRLAEAWLSDRSVLDPDLAGTALRIAARRGDRSLFDRYREAAKKAAERRDRLRLLSSLARFRDPAVLREALSLFLTDEFDPNEARVILRGSLETEEGRAAFWDFLRAHFDAVIRKMPGEAVGSLPRYVSGFCDPARAKEVEEFFRDKVDKLQGAPRALAQTVEEIGLCAAQRQMQEPSVRAFLEKD